jgi:hypothetical protein
MELKDEREVEATREKLRSLETRYQAVSQDPGDDAHIQELTLTSLKRLINQSDEGGDRAVRGAQIPACSPVSLHGHEELSVTSHRMLDFERSPGDRGWAEPKISR